MENIQIKQTALGLPTAKPLEATVRPGQLRGRGTRSNVSGRHERLKRVLFDDGWHSNDEPVPLKTTVTEETAKSIVTKNTSTDLWFDRSINPYRGCEHGCVYCYARPTHANMGLSPGLDFEAKLFAKTNAAEVLRRTFLNKAYKPETIVLGANTDPYQPIERRYRLTRQLLEVMREFSHPVAIVTKSALVLRDLDLIADLAKDNLVKVAISVTTLDGALSRQLEPRAVQPQKRLQALEMLSAAGVPTAVLASPIIPSVNDHEIEKILGAASAAGVVEASFILLRLPLEVRDQFKEWLMDEMPDRAARVISLVRSLHGGKDYDATPGKRMRGTGPYAWTIARRFEQAARRLGLNHKPMKLDTTLFKRPPQPGDQLQLL